MANKAEMDARWAEMSRRLSADPRLAKVMESLEASLSAVGEDEPRRRLKVPYANATSKDSDRRWN